MHELSLTGAPKIALDLFEALRSEIQVRTIALRGGPHEAWAGSLGDLKVLEPLLDKADPESPPPPAIQRTLREYSVWAEEWKPDLIYVNSVASLPIVRRISLPSAPVLLHVHEIGLLLARMAEEYSDVIYSWPTRYIAVSEATRRSMEERCWIPNELISVIHEFIAEQNFASLSQEPVKSPNDRLVVGGSGQVGWRKGIDLWLLTAAELRSNMGRDQVRFVWVGSGEEETDRQFKAMVRKLKLDDFITFVPTNPEPLKYYREFDVFAMTSWEDPCPLVVLETMMLQKPVVCFAGGGGAAEEVGETGLVIDEFSPSKMAAAIAELAQSPERRAALGKAARERVLRHFTDTVQVPKILREIRAVAGFPKTEAADRST